MYLTRPNHCEQDFAGEQVRSTHKAYRWLGWIGYLRVTRPRQPGLPVSQNETREAGWKRVAERQKLKETLAVIALGVT